jgi:uncharacterized membrane protein
MPIFKALHILSMFTMVTSFTGGEFFYAYAIWRRDVHALAAVHRIVERSGLAFVAGGALLAGIAFGLLTAATGGFNFFAGWLINAYLLLAAFVVNSLLSARGIVRLGKKAAEADAGQRPVEEVVRDMAGGHSLRLFVGNVVIFALIILDMVLKL